MVAEVHQFARVCSVTPLSANGDPPGSLPGVRRIFHNLSGQRLAPARMSHQWVVAALPEQRPRLSRHA
jgi:hypothetical protein